MEKFRLLTAEEIECRISTCTKKGVSILLYKDARCDMNILDEVVGPARWQRAHELIDGKLFCNVGINFPDASGFEHWIWKQDVGTESYTEKEKGQASDSFKRACFNWGIGRELYTAPFMWVNATDLATLEEYNGRWTCKDSFKVTAIEYIDRHICYVKIYNNKTKKEIEFGTPKTDKQNQEEIAKRLIDTVKINALLERCKKDEVDTKTIEKLYKVNDIAELNEYKYAHINQNWEKIKAEN